MLYISSISYIHKIRHSPQRDDLTKPERVL